MRMLMLGAASLALAASAGYADPGKGGGGGNGGGHGGGQAAAPAPAKGNGGGGGPGNGGGGPAKGNGAGHVAAAPRASGGGPKDQREAVAPQRAAKVEQASSSHGNGGGKDNAMRGAKPAQQRAAVRDDRGDRQYQANGNLRSNAPVREVMRNDRGSGAQARDGLRTRVVQTVVHFDRDAPRGLIAGCPPGLAKKNNGCMPPGLAQQRNQAYYRPSWFGYPSYNDGRYYYDDGYLYRTNNTGSVLGYIPLLGGALSVGNSWPSYYDPYPVPDYYVDYYNLGAPGSYRYADDVLYRVDPQNDSITSIAALLTGDQFNVGQRLPAGYDVYNVPYAYRDQYYDTPQYDYRYADGYIYQVDPTTQLIQAAIELLV